MARPTEGWREWQTVLGGFLIHLVLGTLYCWGIVTTAVTAHLRKYHAEVTYNQTILVYSTSLGCQGATMLLGGFLESKIGGYILATGTLLAASAESIGFLILTDGVMFGIGMGLCYIPPITCSARWLPHRKGLVTGIIVGGFGGGTFVFGFLANAILYAGKHDDLQNGYFLPDSNVAQSVPSMFTILGCCYFILISLGVILLKEKEDAVNEPADVHRCDNGGGDGEDDGVDGQLTGQGMHVKTDVPVDANVIGMSRSMPLALTLDRDRDRGCELGAVDSAHKIKTKRSKGLLYAAARSTGDEVDDSSHTLHPRPHSRHRSKHHHNNNNSADEDDEADGVSLHGVDLTTFQTQVRLGYSEVNSESQHGGEFGDCDDEGGAGEGEAEAPDLILDFTSDARIVSGKSNEPILGEAPRAGEGTGGAVLRSGPTPHFAPMDVARSSFGWHVASCLITTTVGGMYFAGTYKTFAEENLPSQGDNETYLSAVGSIAAVCNAGGRILWGGLADRFGNVEVMIGMSLLFALLLGTYSLAFEFGRAGFAVWTLGLFFCEGGNFALYPPLTIELFGTKHAASNYGLIFTLYSVFNVCNISILSALDLSFHTSTICMSLVTFVGFLNLVYLRWRVRHGGVAIPPPLASQEGEEEDTF